MQINDLKIYNFRNYNCQEIELCPYINVIYGDNAQGKTNILESIFLCAMGKSFRTNKDKDLIKLGEENAKIELSFQKKDREGKIKIELSDKKRIFLNGIPIKKLSDLVGNINVVIFSPDDIDILKGGPQKRRRFLDVMISQLRPTYIHVLNMYLKTLEQRNTYLKQIKILNKSEEMLDIWDEKLAELGYKIYKYREEFIEKLQNKVDLIHPMVTKNEEKMEIEYKTESSNKQRILDLLRENRKTDILKGFSGKGIHRDDFMIYINKQLINIYGSQGQHRTSILSLKQAEVEIVYDEIGEYPILLLDDFMSELDEKRRRSFLENVENTQILITCTDKINLNKLDYKLYNVNKGKIICE